MSDGKRYVLANAKTGEYADLHVSPMSGKPTVSFDKDVRGASKLTRSQAQALACVIGIVLPDASNHLSIEEADG